MTISRIAFLNLRFVLFAWLVHLPKNHVGRHIGGQLLRSGTGGGSNYEEARGAESRADFIHKLGMAWKDMREANFWLKLIHKSQILKPPLVQNILRESDELSAILGKSLKTAKGK